MTTAMTAGFYRVRFNSAADFRAGSRLLADAYAKVEPLFGKKRLKEVGMMRSDRSPGWVIEAGPGCGEYLFRSFLESLRQAMGRDAFKVEALKAEDFAVE